MLSMNNSKTQYEHLQFCRHINTKHNRGEIMFLPVLRFYISSSSKLLTYKHNS